MKTSHTFYRFSTTALVVAACFFAGNAERVAIAQITKIGAPRVVPKSAPRTEASPLPEPEPDDGDESGQPTPKARRSEPYPTTDARPKQATPKGPLLVLKNGNVIFGEIAEQGDFYRVTSGNDVEIRFPKSQVEMACETLNEAFLKKQPQARKAGAENWLKFISWCIRYRMFEDATRELTAFEEMHPRSRRVAEMRKQIDFQSRAVEVRAEVATPLLPVDPPARNESQKIRELPEDAMEHFTKTVQPILVKNCSSVRCHGGESKNFLLTYSSMSKGFSAQATQRNLRAVLAHIDFRDPNASPLLTMATEVHGGASRPPIADARDRQFHVLAAFVERLAASQLAQRPSSVRPEETTSRPVRPISRETPLGQEEPAAADIDPRELEDAPTLDSIRRNVKPDASESNEERPYEPKDPFDPEVFNRKHHKK